MVKWTRVSYLIILCLSEYCSYRLLFYKSSKHIIKFKLNFFLWWRWSKVPLYTNNSTFVLNLVRFLCSLSMRGGAFRFALVCLSVSLKIYNFITKVEKWGNPCLMETFLVLHKSLEISTPEHCNCSLLVFSFF